MVLGAPEREEGGEEGLPGIPRYCVPSDPLITAQIISARDRGMEHRDSPVRERHGAWRLIGRAPRHDREPRRRLSVGTTVNSAVAVAVEW